MWRTASLCWRDGLTWIRIDDGAAARRIFREGLKMQTTQIIHAHASVGPDKRLRLSIDVPTDLPVGPAEVKIEAESHSKDEKTGSLIDLIGMGKEIWKGIDAQDYVNQLRDE
jgi:hypothetical protein